jgi:hypothetical protein
LGCLLDQPGRDRMGITGGVRLTDRVDEGITAFNAGSDQSEPSFQPGGEITAVGNDSHF